MAVVLLLPVLGFLAVLVAYDTIPLSDTDQSHFDTLIVLGSPADPDGKASVEQRERVMEGVREFRGGRAEHVIMTGGAAHNDSVEAEVMARLAVRAGVPAEAIVVEGRSRNTLENLYFCRKIMDGEGWRSAEVISSPSHLRRAALILEEYRKASGMKWRMDASRWPPEYGWWQRAAYWCFEVIHTTQWRWFGFPKNASLPGRP